MASRADCCGDHLSGPDADSGACRRSRCSSAHLIQRQALDELVATSAAAGLYDGCPFCHAPEDPHDCPGPLQRPRRGQPGTGGSR